MAGEQKKIRLESWKYPRNEVKALMLIENMLKLGSPVVDRGGVMSWIICDELGLRVQPMTKDNLAAEMYMTTDYLVQKSEKAVDHAGKVIVNDYGEPIRRITAVIGDIHRHVINTAYGLRKNGLWKLRLTLTYPIVNRNGEIVIKNGLYWKDVNVNGVMVAEPDIHLADGYDAASQCFFAIPEKKQRMVTETANQKPATHQMEEALNTLDEFMCDFTFATDSAKASAIAFMLTLVCREIIDGHIPMLEVRAPESQSGKTLFVCMMIEAVTGERPRLFSPNFKNVEEFEKELFSRLMEGKNYVFMDNVYGKVQSAFLDAALTSFYISKRVLSTNVMASVYTGMPFVMTANNPTLSDDMKNRVYLLDILKPEEGKQFVHENPEAYALEKGPEVLKALFTLYNNWVKNYQKKKYTARRIDGFIEWSAVIGGILEAAGIPGFLEDTQKQIKEVSPDVEQAAYMARYWYEGKKNEQGEWLFEGKEDAWLFVQETFVYAEAAEYVSKDDSFQKKNATIGNKLKKFRMVKLPGGYRFEKNEDETRGSQWRVVKDGD